MYVLYIVHGLLVLVTGEGPVIENISCLFPTVKLHLPDLPVITGSWLKQE
jgi:hypothetical protein